MGTIIELPGSGLQPIRQGDLDGLCDLYAAINGIRLALARSADRALNRNELQRLFSGGVSFLATHHQLTCATLAGFEKRLWPELVDMLVDKAAKVTDARIRCWRPLHLLNQPTASEVSRLIGDAARNQQPVLAGLAGRYEHYTVVERCTPDYFHLFDSGNLHRLARAACRIDEENGRERHIIRPGSLIVIEAAEG